MAEVKYLDQMSTVEYLESFLEKAKAGEITEVIIIGRRGDGSTHVAASKTKNCHEMAGILMDAAMMRLGYEFR